MNIVFIGDSLTEYFDWQKRFPEHHVINLGIAGESVEGLLDRMDRIILGTQDPDMIFVMTGINNVAMEDYDILDACKQIINKLFSAFEKSKIVVQSILPVNLPWIDNNIIKNLNGSLQNIAKNFMAEYLNVYSLFMDSRGYINTDCLLDDGVHLSDKGYEIWAKAVEEFLNYPCNKTSSSLSSSSSE